MLANPAGDEVVDLAVEVGLQDPRDLGARQRQSITATPPRTSSPTTLRRDAGGDEALTDPGSRPVQTAHDRADGHRQRQRRLRIGETTPRRRARRPGEQPRAGSAANASATVSSNAAPTISASGDWPASAKATSALLSGSSSSSRTATAGPVDLGVAHDRQQPGTGMLHRRRMRSTGRPAAACPAPGLRRRRAEAPTCRRRGGARRPRAARRSRTPPSRSGRPAPAVSPVTPGEPASGFTRIPTESQNPLTPGFRGHASSPASPHPAGFSTRGSTASSTGRAAGRSGAPRLHRCAR